MAGINITIHKKLSKSVYNDVESNGEFLYQSNGFYISAEIPYPHYPLNIWENSEYVFITEGYFFEWIDYKNKCEGIADICFNNDVDLSELRQIFGDTDAEFVLFIKKKSDDRFIIVNDVLGRLPLYFSQSKETWNITRNILPLRDKIPLVLDQETAIDALVFGYTLGSETIYKNVTRIVGGTVIYRAEEKICFDTYYQINYDEIKNNNWQWESLPNLISLFVEGLINRIKFSDLNIVALSGGLDSRTVAAGFHHAGIDCRFISFQDANGDASKDLKVAEIIAAVYQRHLEIYQLDSPTEFDFELLFEKKAGINSLDMSFVVPYLKYLAGLSGQSAMFTGDGGDKVFPDLTPPIPRPTISLLRNYVFYSNQKLPITVAKKIMRNENYSPLKKVFDLLQSYPEKTMSGKYIHFLMDNRVGNWLNEGEDRNRNFIISLTPFYNLRFYKALMSVPDRYKADFTLYRKFLELLAPALANIDNANWGFPLTEKRKISKVYLKEDMKRTRLGVLLKETLKNKKNYFKSLSETETNLFDKYAADQMTSATFNLKYATSLKNFDTDNFYCLLTLMKVTTLS